MNWTVGFILGLSSEMQCATSLDSKVLRLAARLLQRPCHGLRRSHNDLIRSYLPVSTVVGDRAESFASGIPLSRLWDKRKQRSSAHFGSLNKASHPRAPLRFARLNEPPCASAICRLRARPIPEPPGFVVKNG